MYLPYEMLRHFGPADLTPHQQRELDNQRGRLAAALTRSNRTQHTTIACNSTDSGLKARTNRNISKKRREVARRQALQRHPA